MTINLENFVVIKQQGEELYKSFTPVKCPYFNDFVYFTAEGLGHLKYKYRNRERLPQDQYTRFKLLYIVPTVLRLSRTVQGIMQLNTTERVLRNNKHCSLILPATFYEFVAVIDQVRLRVVIKQVEQGKYMFWSIIPYWKKSVQGERQMHDGNISEL